MLDPNAAADNITGIAAAEAIEERRRIEGEIADAQRGLNGALIEVAAYWQSQLSHEQAQNIVADLQRRLAAVNQQLEQGGVTPDDLTILADAPRYDRARSYLDELSRSIETDRRDIQTGFGKLISVDVARYADAMTFSTVGQIAELVARSRLSLQAQLDAVVVVFDKLAAELSTTRVLFEGEATAFEIRYQDAKRRQAAHGALIAESERLAAQLKEASAAEARAEESAARRKPAEARFAAARSRLTDLLAARLAILKSSADQIGEKSAGSLKARESRDRRPADKIQALSALFEGSRFRDPLEHCADWVVSLMSNETDVNWTTMCDRLIDVYRQKIFAGSPEEPGFDAAEALRSTLFNGSQSLTTQQLSKIYSNLTDQKIGAVLSATPRDGISLTYVSDGRDIPFAKASPGQQASALLRLLLRQSAGTLIIDQPEDDLDNRVLMEIVKQIRTSKSNRQLIFATHNPNLVVNGDADKVVTMRATVPEDRAGERVARVRVEIDGAIETPEVRESITSIMEGGLEAFDLRARKYGVDV